MPELPEVETITRALKKVVVGEKIKELYLGNKKLRFPYPNNFSKHVIGESFSIPFRRAKYCVLPLLNGKKIVIHLGMSGQIRILNEKVKIEKHDHVIIYLNNGIYIKYTDPRRFGFIKLLENKKDEIHLFETLGPEPMSKVFNAKYLYEKIKNKNKTIKDILMDQTIVAGLGNIYVNECLFLSKTSPFKIGSKISFKNSETIVCFIKLIIKKAILKGGTSIRDHIQPDGKLGYFKNNLKVYGKENKNCKFCNQKIKLIKQSNRSTFFCEFCQK